MAKVKNMTTGNPLTLILNFAVPLLFGNLLQQTYNMMDAAIVGKVLGADALASVGVSSSVQFLILGFCMGICAGFGIPLAKHFGAGDISRLKNSVFNAYVLTGSFALVLTTVTAFLCPWILHQMNTPENIYQEAHYYLLILLLGIPFSLLYNLQAGMLRAVGDSRTPFIFLAVSTGLNIGMDLLFIIVFGLGCGGAALATILAQGMSGIACFIYIQKRCEVLRPDKSTAKISGRALWELFYMGVPMGLQYSITAIGTMVMQRANNNLGSIYVSAFAAASKLKQFAMCPFDSVATGVSVFCGQNIGAGKVERINRGIFSGLAVTVSYSILIGVVLILFGRPMSLMFVDVADVEVLEASALYAKCIGMFLWAIGFLNVTRMTIQGLGYSSIAIFSGVLEMIARIIVTFVFVPKYGYRAICFTDQTAWIVAMTYCCIVCAWCVKRVKRKTYDERKYYG